VNFCTSTTVVNITEPAVLQITNLAGVNPTCVPNNNGSITVTATGGTVLYQYNINGGTNQGSNVFNALIAGTYTIQVTDANLCTVTSTITLNSPNSPIINSALLTNVSCFGGNNGQAVVTSTGGTAPITYAIAPNVGAQAVSGTFTGLTAQGYTITVTDGNGCTGTTAITITEPVAALVASSSVVSNVTCNGLCNGSAQASAVGGTTAYSYTAIAGPGTPLINASTGLATALCAGTYTITVTDFNLCTATTTVTITEPTAVSITSAVGTNVTCNGLNNGQIVVT
jgi:hypothetical protein